MGSHQLELQKSQTLSEIIFEVVSKNWSHQIGPIHDQQYVPIEPIISPLVFGVVAALISAIILSIRYNSVTEDNDLFKEFSNFVHYVNVKSALHREILFIGACGGCFLVLTPILAVIVCSLLTYKTIVQWIIKKKHQNHFREFLSGSDAVWALEDDVSRSVINIMGVFKIPLDTSENPSQDMLIALRERIGSKLMSDVQQFSKMFYTRRHDMGFYFWTNENPIQIEEYIRLMPDDGAEDVMSNSGEYFGQQCNSELPRNNTTSWEILVGRRPWQLDAEYFYCPVLFRIHHSLGDGVALLRLFLEAVTDKQQATPAALLLKSSDQELQLRDLSSEKKQSWNGTEALEEIIKRYLSGFDSNAFLRRIIMLCTTPAAMIRQSVCQKIDENHLHKTSLSGNKVIAWHFERDNEHLIRKIKTIKSKSNKSTFTNVLLAALSNSIENYLEYKHMKVPDDMTIVLPKRVENEGVELKLQNKFSVAFQSMPISSKNQMQNIRFKLNEINNLSDTLYKTSNYLVNYWMMSYMAWLLPTNLMRPLCKSVHCTMVLSNLPGPQDVITINGFEMSNILFWLPNRGNSGLGLSVLSYNNRLQIGLLADKSVVGSSDDLDYILQHFIYHLGNCNLGDN